VGLCEQPSSLSSPKGSYGHGGYPDGVVGKTPHSFKSNPQRRLFGRRDKSRDKSNVLTASCGRDLGRNPAMRGVAMRSQAGWKVDGACAKLKHRRSGYFAPRLTLGRRKEAATDRAPTRCVFPATSLDSSDG